MVMFPIFMLIRTHYPQNAGKTVMKSEETGMDLNCSASVSRGRMASKYHAQYLAKKCSPEQAVSVINDGDVVYSGGEPNLLLNALYTAGDRFKNVTHCSMFGIMGTQGSNVNSEELAGHVRFTATVLKHYEERAWATGRPDQILVPFSEMERLIEQRHRPNAVMTHCSSMDDDGYFYMGNHPSGARTAVDCGAKVLVQTNDQMPLIYSDHYRVHISEVTAVCEISEPVLSLDAPIKRVATDVDITIASHIVERIPNGASIQLGVGTVPDIVGKQLENHKDLGIHTEAFIGAYIDLIKKGVVNNSKKELCPGISVAAIFIGGALLAPEIISRNPLIQMKKLAWINNPENIGQISNLISINSCLGVDLRGQVCSESIGMSVTGGIGGQLDFVRGARLSKGGKSFIAFRSTVEKKDGGRISKISLDLPVGSIVSTPRSDVMYVVTEYGVADLLYKSVKERAEALIAVAHPDFRDDLRFKAKESGLIY